MTRILSEIFVAGFAGLMTLLLSHTILLSDDWVGLGCGLAGWIGSKFLDHLP